MNPPARIEARSAWALPCTRSGVETATPTKPVKMFRTVTSRFWMNVGWFSTAVAATTARRSVKPSHSTAPSATGTGAAGRRHRLAGRREVIGPRLSDQPDAVHDEDGADKQQHDPEQHGFLLLLGRSVAEHPRSAGLVPVRERTAGFAGDDIGLVRALLFAVQEPSDRLGEERQARRREDAPGVGPAARAGGGSRRLPAGPRHVEGPAGLTGERVDGHVR